MPLAPLSYESHRLVILDQTRLPQEAAQIELRDLAAVVEAICALRVRGAPLIGTAAAFGVCVALRGCGSLAEARARAPAALGALRASRPTAVNLFWALERMERALAGLREPGWFAALEGEALAIQRETEAQDAALIEHGLALLVPGARAITHCNTGPLATGALGTALGVLIAGHRRLGGLHVYADETRPRWQGALLTTWELANHGVPHTLIADGAAAALMRRGGIHSVWVGADRIAANGDTANKIGTYGLALAARAHGIPCYVAAPTTTVDLSLPDGAGIPIEEREAGEVAAPRGMAVAPPGTAVWNPAFDVTPAALISAIVTERGVHRPSAPGGPYDLRRELGRAPG
ncbi:MAG: S-methyl-5-thioribose-1-phosphate isomerase [Candidatus Lambdaproteobacteria bacterium]|nr:S-methyl-5-thioribose-1-phosphate isomerase [Candidatus Lambdaproteobacteria bacterium]